jgi:hypothetical protein
MEVQFNAGKGLSNVNEKAAIAGGIAGATSTLWRRHMEQLLYCTPTTAQKKYYLGLMDY